MERKKEVKEKEEIAKHSALVEITNNITAVQRKAFNVLLFFAKEQIDKHNPVSYKFNINASLILDKVGLGKKHHVYLKKFLEELRDIKVKYNILNKAKEKWGSFSLLAGFDYENGLITYSFPHQILDTLIDPEMYAYIDLVIIKGLKSKYAIALYEILKDYEKVEFPKISINKFRELMGVDKRKYSIFTTFRKRVIDKAVSEINNGERINFFVSYKLYKTGNKYTHIKFIVEPKSQKDKLEQQIKNYKSLSEDPDLREALFIIPEEYRYKKSCYSLLSKALEKKDKIYIIKQIQYTLKKSPKDFCAYLKGAIEKDYAGIEEVEFIPLEEDWKSKIVGKIVVNSKTGEKFKIAHIGEQDEEGYYEVRLDKLDNPDTIKWFKWTEDKIRKLIRK